MIPFAQGVGFAIPVNTIKWVVQQIREKGRVVRPWLGIYGTTLNEALARRYQLPADSGVLVVEVDPRGPAYESGLRVGDVMIGIGTHEIKQMKDVLSAISKHAIAEDVELTFLRGGWKRSTQLRLREAPMPTPMVRR
jgi:S1-C subfamily serine protease